MKKMTLNITKSTKQKTGGITRSPQINVNPILVIAKKTLIFNVCTIKRLIISIFVMVLVPAIVIAIANPIYLPASITLTEALGLILFFYTYGLVYPILISAAASPLIAEELKSGTLITLVSKPISRPGIVAGKLIALFIYGIIVSLISLLILIIISITKYPFPDLFQFFILNFVYSLIIMICFGGLSIGFSSLVKKPRNAILVPIFLIIFSFLVGIMIKSFITIGGAGAASIYETFQIYHFDISYHMGNIYKALADIYVPGASNSWGTFFLIFGITKYDPTLYCNEYGTCATVYNLTIPTNYYFPILSGLFLFLIGILLVIGGTLFLKTRDIS